MVQALVHINVMLGLRAWSKGEGEENQRKKEGCSQIPSPFFYITNCTASQSSSSLVKGISNSLARGTKSLEPPRAPQKL